MGPWRRWYFPLTALPPIWAEIFRLAERYGPVLISPPSMPLMVVTARRHEASPRQFRVCLPKPCAKAGATGHRRTIVATSQTVVLQRPHTPYSGTLFFACLPVYPGTE